MLYEPSAPELTFLHESAPLMEQWSTRECAAKRFGGMEEWAKRHASERQLSCDWYHGTWQYLRLLNMVAIPNWYEFYEGALSSIFRRNPNADVLIAAAADYGMLATVHTAASKVRARPRIAVHDICPTPLRACEFYARVHDFSIACVCSNLLSEPLPEGSYDLVVTDEFLTVIDDAYKPAIAKVWHRVLRPGGSLVTTAMIGAPTTPELRDGYMTRARKRLELQRDSWPDADDPARMQALLARFEAFAKRHTRHMLAGRSALDPLLADYTDVRIERTTTPGECVTPTDSFQIVARKP